MLRSTASPLHGIPLTHVLVILALPVLVTVALPDWFYTFTGALDHWVYHGFFRHLDVYLSGMFEPTYYGTRLGWLIPGYLAYQWLSPPVANVALHVVCYVAAAFALYGVVTAVADRARALFAVIAFGLYFPVIRSLGDDYADTAVLVYGLLATAAMVRAALPDASRWPAVFAGMAMAAMVHSNIGTVLLLPSILVWILPLSVRRAAWTRVAVLLPYCLAGVALCTTVLGLASKMLGGRWLFFMPNLSWMGTQSSASYAGDPFDWIMTSQWSFLLFALAASAIVEALVFRRRRHLNELQLKALISFGLAFLALSSFNFIGLRSLLSLPYYASWTYGSAFILLGAVIVRPTPSPRVWYPVLLAFGVLLLLSIDHYPLIDLRRMPQLSLAACLALGLIAPLARSALAGVGTVAALLVCMNGSIFGLGLSPDSADIFRVVDRVTRLTESHLTSARPRYLLTDDNRLMFNYQVAIASVYLWGYSVVTTTFPSVEPQDAAAITPGTVVVLLSDTPSNVERFDTVFAPHGLQADPLEIERIETVRGPLHLAIVRAKAVPAGEAADSSSSAADAEP